MALGDLALGALRALWHGLGVLFRLLSVFDVVLAPFAFLYYDTECARCGTHYRAPPAECERCEHTVFEERSLW